MARPPTEEEIDRLAAAAIPMLDHIVRLDKVSHIKDEDDRRRMLHDLEMADDRRVLKPRTKFRRIAELKARLAGG